MIRVIQLLAIPVFTIISLQASAQSEDSSAVAKPGTQVTIGTTFASKLHYFGRTDSLKSSALIPSATLNFNNGLYVSSSLVLLNNVTTTLAYTAVLTEAGYKFGKTEGVAGSIFADKFFYVNNSTLPQSVQKAQAGFTLTEQNKIINVNVGGNAAFSNDVDFFANGGLDHPFLIKAGKTILVLVPTVTINAGTQNFTNSYITKRNILLVPSSSQTVTEYVKKFQILDYEASLPITVVYNRFTVSLIPSFVIPQNVADVAGKPINSTSNLFYANLGFTYTLGRQ